GTRPRFAQYTSIPARDAPPTSCADPATKSTRCGRMASASSAARYGRGSGLYAPARSAVITRSNVPARAAANVPSRSEQFVTMKRGYELRCERTSGTSGHGLDSPQRCRSSFALGRSMPTVAAASRTMSSNGRYAVPRSNDCDAACQRIPSSRPPATFANSDHESSSAVRRSKPTAAYRISRLVSARMTDVRSQWHHSKSEPVARDGMVTAEHHLAAEAGIEMLRDGGNAVDAAVAAAFAMGVVEPFTSGIGGIAGLVIRRADGTVVSIEGPTRAPLGARADMFELVGDGSRAGMYLWPAVKGGANVDGATSVSVPGQAAALCLALERYGSLPRARVMEPAIRLAREGFEIDWYVALSFAMYAERLWKAGDARRIFYRPSGAPLRPPIGTEPSD